MSRSTHPAFHTCARLRRGPAERQRRALPRLAAAPLLVALTASCAPAPREQPDASVDAADATAPPDACARAAGHPDDHVAAAACRAIGPFARGEFTEPFDLLLADVTARRFEVEALSTAWTTYAAALHASPSVGLRVFARVADASVHVSLADLASLGAIDAYTAAALHCRDHPLPEGFSDALERDLEAGGYGSTHVLLALVWLDEQGCPTPTDDALREAVLASTARNIDTDHSWTTDLEMESAALLAHVGEADRIPDGFLSGVVSTQQPSGSWAESAPTGPASGHTSGLALWYLHEALFPGRAVPMVNPSARTH